MMFGGGGPEVPIARLVDECGGDAGRFFLNKIFNPVFVNVVLL